MKLCKESVLTLLFSIVILSCAKENQCPGGEASCPENSTCCPLHDGSYGCCPIKDAVCCADSVHCCPGGYTCDVIKGVCQIGDKSKPLLKKIPAFPTVVCCWFICLFTNYSITCFIQFKVWACSVYIYLLAFWQGAILKKLCEVFGSDYVIRMCCYAVKFCKLCNF